MKTKITLQDFVAKHKGDRAAAAKKIGVTYPTISGYLLRGAKPSRATRLLLKRYHIKEWWADTTKAEYGVKVADVNTDSITKYYKQHHGVKK
jgi:hypothetical protein